MTGEKSGKEKIENSVISSGEQNCEPIIKEAGHGRTVSYKNKTLLSSIDPVSRCERSVREARLMDRTLYFCPSPLFGYGLDTLLSLITPDSAVLCIETDEKLFSLSTLHMDKHLLNNPRIALTGIKNSEELFCFIREKWGARTFRRIETVKLSGGWQLDSGVYAEMEKVIRSGFAVDWSNAMTLVKLGRRFMYNVIRNISTLQRSDNFDGLSFGRKPVLVLGAGPSLDPLLDKLQDAGIFNHHRNSDGIPFRKFALVCVDTCLSLLKEREIMPDIAVILESQFWNLRDFNSSKNSKIPAAVDLSAYPGSVNILGGKTYFFCTPWTSLQFFDRLLSSGFISTVLPPLGSVGLTAVELSRRISSGLILTAGIDFSFTMDKLHARSSPAHLSALMLQNRFTSHFNAKAAFMHGVYNTISKSNIPVKSNPAMRNYRNLFETEFSGSRIKDIEGSGLPLGVETLKIEEVIKILLADTINDSGETENTMTSRKNYLSVLQKQENLKANLINFVNQEKSILETLRNSLTGNDSSEPSAIENLLDQAGYLWAHFPECAGAEGRRPPLSDLVFLKQVRSEIDPFIKLWELAYTILAEEL